MTPAGLAAAGAALPVAIVGRAWRTPLGATVDGAIARLLAGERAAAIDPRGAGGEAGHACTLVASIAGEPARSRHAKFLRRLGLHGLDVAREALAASGVAGGPRVGLFSGVGGLRAHWNDMLPALERQQDDARLVWERGLRDVHPYWMLRHLSNSVHALASADLGVRGEGATFGGGNAGAQALAAAARTLHAGAIDAALVVAHDSLLEPETLVELGARRAATHATDPGALAAPYAPEAAGFVPGEAAAAVVLVRPADAGAPRALLAASAVADGARAEPASGTLAHALAAVVARERGGAAPPPVAFADGAARAWPELDAEERALLSATVAPDLALTAITAAFGQLGAATTIVQAIALAELLGRGTAPPIAGLARVADGPCRLLAAAEPIAARVALALSTSAPGLAAAVRVELA